MIRSFFGCLFCLLVACACIGCTAKTEPTVSVPNLVSQGQSSESSQPGNTVSSSGEISLVSGTACNAYDGVRFTLPVGWELTASTDANALFLAQAGDESCEVSVYRTQLYLFEGLTPEMLLKESQKTLPKAWEDAGGTDVQVSSGETVYLDQKTPTLFLQAHMDGTLVFQRQLYFTVGDELYLLTVTSRGTDLSDSVLKAFYEI